MKEFERGRVTFQRYKFIMNTLSIIFRIFGRKINNYFFVLSRYKKGKIGLAIRYIFLRNIVKSIGSNVSIFEGVFILNPENLSIGNNVSIHPMCYIDAIGNISIANDVSIAHSVSIISFEHQFSDSQISIKDQKLVINPINIKDNVWIGLKATILSGVTVNSGSVIGANALVNKDVQANTVVAGVPARIINIRS